MRLTKLVLLSSALLAQSIYAHGPLPGPLTNVPIPEVPGLLDGSSPIVVNKDMAIALGKALFWDINLGSDGMACGSCHFHAGADSRVKNQLNPGLKSSHLESGSQFDVLGSGEGGANHTLTAADFPLYKLANPFDPASETLFETDDVVASSGTFSGLFKGASRLTGANDTCSRSSDSIFHVDGVNTRRVEPRNAPTVINAIFNYRNFWDGRANNIYNGSSPWGDRDPDAGVWVKTGISSVKKQRLHLENSSLASLAMGPPLSDTEMSCIQRKWPDIGRKLLLRQPLQGQKVHYQDSVFAALGLVNSTATAEKVGLKATYKTMITKAFNAKYWSYTGGSSAFPAPPSGQTPYNQMEANFSMFFGLALQLYQGTLVSDQAPIDLVKRATEFPTSSLYLRPDWTSLYPNDSAKVAQLDNGFDVFVANHCATCHGGPLMTVAPIATYSKLVTPTPGSYYGSDTNKIFYGINALGPQKGSQVAGITSFGNVVTRDTSLGEYAARFVDIGFANTGVADPESDPGLGGKDDFGNPLSFSYQYQQYLAGYTNKVLDTVVNKVRACDFIHPLYDGTTTQSDPMMFTAIDAVEDDGARDGVQKTQNCIVSPLYGSLNKPKIPTVAAAQAALNQPKMAIGTKAAFKIPTLRNVELTGPYMHNGSMANLEQVVEFYSRLGNYVGIDVNDNQHSFMNSISLVGSQLPLGSNTTFAKSRADLIAFLKTFTDERVRYEQAPFDHPEVRVPNGHVGDASAVTPGNTIQSGLAVDEFLLVPAVGANGKPDPIQPFENHLAP